MKEYILYENELPVDLASLCKHRARQEIVRCRDCKHGFPLTDSAYITCGRRFQNGQKHEADWFCPDGDRKDGDGGG